MRRRYQVLLERDEEGHLVAHVPELQAHTQAQSWEEPPKRLEGAVAVSLDEENVRLLGLEKELEIEAA